MTFTPKSRTEILDNILKSMSGMSIAFPSANNMLKELESVEFDNQFMGKVEFNEAYAAVVNDMLLEEVSEETTEWIGKFQKRIYERMKWRMPE